MPAHAHAHIHLHNLPVHVPYAQLPFIEPDYLPLPEVPERAEEEPLPIFLPPEVLRVGGIGHSK